MKLARVAVLQKIPPRYHELVSPLLEMVDIQGVELLDSVISESYRKGWADALEARANQPLLPVTGSRTARRLRAKR